MGTFYNPNMTPELRENIKKYIQYCREHKDELLNIKDKNPFNLPPNIKRKIDDEFCLTLEATTSSAVGAYMTPFAFSKKGIGNTKAAQMFGFKLCGNNKLKKEDVMKYRAKNGLVQHGDPFEDPNLAGMRQGDKAGQRPIVEINDCKNSIKKLLNEILPQELKQTDNIKIKKEPVVQKPNVRQNVNNQSVDMSDYDINTTFSDFDKELKSSTEDIKLKYQKAIQDKIVGKKVILRASKGYKQPEEDFTVNVIGVQIDYYYDRYYVIVVGREEKSQKVHKFFVMTGFTIKILGNSNKKGDDVYQISKYTQMTNPVDNNQNVNNNNNIR